MRKTEIINCLLPLMNVIIGLSVVMADQFFVTLFSNSSMTVFPGNTLSKFRVKLSQTLRFHDDWDVAHAELSLPFAIENIKRGMNVVSLLKAKDYGQILGAEDLSLAPNQSVLVPLNTVLVSLSIGIILHLP